MKKAILLVAVLVFITAGWFLFLGDGETQTFVTVYVTRYIDLENTLEFSGEVCPAAKYNVMSETGGTVRNLKVFEGEAVKAGDTLFVLDDADLKTQLKEARLRANILGEINSKTVLAQKGGGVAADKAKLAIALSQTVGYDYDSLNQAFGSDAAQQIQQASATLAESLSGLGINTSDDGSVTTAQIELADVEIQRLEKLIDNMSIRSKIKGTVIAVNVNEGEVLPPGLPAMVVADTDRFIITGFVYEKDVQDLKAGMDVCIIADEKTYKGKIKRVGVSALGQEGSASAFDSMAKIEIEPEGDFKRMLGAAVDLKILLSSKNNVLSIPVDCLTSDGCVFVLDSDDTAHRRAIVTGFEDAFFVEVLDGVEAGERLVVCPKNVKDGEKLSYDKGE